MKKIICAILTLVLILSLAACGNGGGSGDETPKMISHTPISADKFLSQTQNASYALSVTAHARLKLYFDADKKVTAVECLNPDGAELFGSSGYAAVSQSYEELLEQIVAQLGERGHLEAGSLMLAAAAVDDTKGMDELLQTAITTSSHCLKQNGLNVIISTTSTLYPDGILPETVAPQVSDTPDPDPTPTPSPTPSEEPSGVVLGANEVVLEQDIKGNILKTEEPTSDGGRIYREYSTEAQIVLMRREYPDGTSTVTTYTDSLPTKVVDQEGNVTTMSYHTDKSLSIEIIRYANGDHQETNFDLSGNTTYFLLRREDGSWEERNYISAGKLSYTVDSDADGNKTSHYYHYNGQIAAEVVQGTDGYYSETNYNEIGTPISKSESDAEGKRVETSYYANGKRQSMVITYADESVQIWTYTEDGTTGSMTDETGSYTETYHPNGQRATLSYTPSDKAEANFAYEETTYDDTGALLTRSQVRADGVRVSITYQSEDTYTAVYASPEGEEYTEYWYKNTQIGGIDIDGEPYGKTFDEI